MVVSFLLGDLYLISLFGQEVFIHIVDVIAGEFSLKMTILAECADKAAAIDAAPVFHIPGELAVIIMLELVEVQVDLAVLILNHIDQKVLFLFILEILDLVVN